MTDIFSGAREGLRPLSLTERPDDFVNVAEVTPEARFDIRYFGADNFVGAPIDGYEAPICYLTRPAAQALAQVAAEAARRELALLVFDGYRPARAVAHFARWAADPSDQRTKALYYPDIEKADLFAQGYLAARSGHSRGSTVDLTLVEPHSGRELDMGTPFDLFGPASWTDCDHVSRVQRANRELLAGLMGAAGFVGFHMEWWHFTLADEPFPDTYFDFPIR
ncbi:MAG: peptidase M15 [Rhizobiales bacterium 17-65-6]|nr:MAG: peptidase M15 [Rhizobiales bacterium 17-65-6]